MTSPVTARSGDADLQALGRTVSRGILALVSRTVAMQIVVFGGSVALMRLLNPREFGVFAIVQSVLAIAVFFGDTGVAGALVRQKEAPTERQLSSVFYLQLAVSLALMASVIAVAGVVPRVWPDLPGDAGLLLQIMAADFVLVSLRIPPMLLLERRLRFGALSIVDVAGSLTFYLVAVALAVAGFGVWALAAAVLTRAALVTIIVFSLSAWRPRALFAWADLRPLVRFGLAQQSRNIIALVNDAVIPFWGGRMLGITAVGYLNWARQTAYFPLKMVDTLRTVGFPLFARLQDDRALLGESLGRAIHLSAFVTCASVGLCIGLGEPLTRFVFSEQWLPAVPLLVVFSGAISIGFLSPLVASALDAIGRPGVFARIALLWTTITWIAVPIGTAYGGTLGFAIGYASHVVVGNIVIAEVVRRMLPEARVWRRVRAPFAAACVMAAVGRLVLAPYAAGGLSFLLAAIGALSVYASLVWLLDREALLQARSIVPRESAAAAAPEATPELVAV
jgi:O-antigen/teichoic acid export membrane protein